jgi:Domain of unknown function (DUF4160)
MRLACWFSRVAKTNLVELVPGQIVHLTHARSSSRPRLSLFLFQPREHEPRHVHVEQAERYAKFWLDPIELTEARGFRGSELRELYSIIEQHREKFIIAWDEHFGQ